MDASPSTYFQQRQPSAAHVNVVDVRDIGDDVHAVWTFDTNVSAITDGAALLVEGSPPDIDQSVTGLKTVQVGYSGGISPGNSWSIDTAPPGITFAGGATLTTGQFGIVS